MEFLLNWLVLLVSMAGIIVVAAACCSDLLRRAGKQVAPQAPSFVQEQVSPTVVEPNTATACADIVYRQNGEDRHTQVVYDTEPTYIGAISCDMGPGIPLRYVKVFQQDGVLCCVNEDWQAPANVRDESGDEIQLQPGQVVQISSGTELVLMNGWTVEFRMREEEVGS